MHKLANEFGISNTIFAQSSMYSRSENADDTHRTESTTVANVAEVAHPHQAAMLTNNEARKAQRLYCSDLRDGSDVLSMHVVRLIAIVCLSLIGAYLQSPEPDATQTVSVVTPVNR